MPKYRMVIHIEDEFEAEHHEDARNMAMDRHCLTDTQIIPHIEEVIEHKEVIGYMCTECDRNIVPMYTSDGQFLCPWCRSVKHIKPVHKGE